MDGYFHRQKFLFGYFRRRNQKTANSRPQVTLHVFFFVLVPKGKFRSIIGWPMFIKAALMVWLLNARWLTWLQTNAWQNLDFGMPPFYLNILTQVELLSFCFGATVAPIRKILLSPKQKNTRIYVWCRLICEVLSCSVLMASSKSFWNLLKSFSKTKDIRPLGHAIFFYN